MKIEKALPIAQKIAALLAPYCVVVKIAGSIRRGKAEVKDIEILCLPGYIIEPVKFDLFGEPEGNSTPVINPKFVLEVNGLGKVIKGKPTGKYMQIELIEGINLDLFMPDEFDFYRQYAIRTGSAEYSHKVIAAGWRKIGWVGSDKGLRMDYDCEQKTSPTNGKPFWVCKNEHAEKPPVWQDEKEFFEWIKVPYKQPQYRNI